MKHITKRAALLIATVALASSGTSVIMPAKSAYAAAAVQTGASTAASAAAGAAAPITVNVTSTVNANVLVDVEIFDAQLRKVHQMFIDNISLTANETKSVPFSWNVPATLAPGKYIVSLGVFGAGWSSPMYTWHAGAASIDVTASGGGNGGGTGGGSQNPDPAPTFTLSATAAPDSAAAGGKIAVDASVTAATYGDALVEVTLKRPDGSPAAPGSSFPASFGTGETKHFAVEWNVPADAPLGTYTVEIGAYNMDRTRTYSVNANAGSFTVKAAEQPNASPIKVQLQTGTSASTQMPTAAFRLVNTGKTAVNLADVKARYYFTADSEAALSSVDFWSTVAKSSVTAKFEAMPIPAADADTYLEIGFAQGAGMLQPGSSVIVSTWFHKDGWGSFNQTNDYSFNGKSDYTDSTTAPGYLGGKLAWGREPVLLDMPAAPTGIVSTPSDTQIALSWAPVEGATEYEIVADGTPIRVLGTSYTAEWLRPGTYHTFKVRTWKGTTSSVWSGTMKVRTTGEQQLPAPAGVRAEASEGAVKLSWKPLAETITGYEVEVDGTVLDVGMALSYEHGGLTAGSAHTYRVRAKDGSTLGPWSMPVRAQTPRVVNGPFDVRFTIDPSAERAPISPYIYGTNDELTGTENWTSRRMGGNRLSTFNWENNASNAGADYFYQSDAYIPWYYGGVMDRSKYDIPGLGATAFHDKVQSKGGYTLLTLQMAGYVAKDKDGTGVYETAPSSRWVEVKPAKNAPFSLTPDVTDGFVYMDEFVNMLTQKYGSAQTATGVKGYELDNETALWPVTHPYMHPGKTSGVEVLNKGAELAKAVKKVDPAAEIFGPVSYGFSEYLLMDNKAEWEQIKGSYAWYLDYYLDKMRIESEKAKQRLLDVLDLHWYPEATDGSVRVSDPYTPNTVDTYKARLQAPRSLWDASYREKGWIGDWYSEFLPLIPRLQQSIDQYNPGTKLAFTEYNYGGDDHFSGGIATADVLGIFGKYNVYMANYWRMTGSSAALYPSAAVKMYTNYDGQGGKFGDTKVKAETSDTENSSVYGSVYKDSDNNLHLIVINKNFDHEMNAQFEIDGGTAYKSARVWAFDSESPAITERTGVASIAGNTFTLQLPKLTVAHIVLSAQ
ncbi:glycoside hydrolase family 44 protein [Paenibacillus chartarius]|uniref:Glycoside hydrolase family 44 protein n=1 Tax=Paenibacillus chartarius TaxID=747481 RepID=A0ABV6DLB3_9BACL